MVIDVPQLYTLCFLVQDGKILLQKRNRPPFSGQWNAPGGKVDPLEAPHEACIREVEEETGLRIRNPRLQAVVTIGSTSSTEDDTATLFVFTSTRYVGTLRSSDEGEVAWWPLADVVNHPNVARNLVQLLPYVQNPDDRPVSGKLIYERGRLFAADFRMA